MASVKIHPPGSRKSGAGKWRAWVSLGKDPITGKYKPQTKVFYAEGKTQAKQIAAEWETELRRAAGRDVTAATFGQLIDRYLDDDPDNLRANTRATYQRYLEKHIRPRLGDRRILTLEPSDFSNLRAALLEAELAPSTVNQCLAICRSVCRHGIEGLGWLSTNPAKIKRAKMSKASVTSTSVGDYLDLVDKLTQIGDIRLLSFVQVAAMTGARRSELGGLQWGDLRNGELTIERSVDEKRNIAPTKTHASRTIPLQPECIEVLQAWHDHRLAGLRAADSIDRRKLEDHWFIWGDDDRPWDPERSEVWTKALAEHGGQVKLHGLRHMAATLMIGAGIDPRAAANRLGHSSPTMTADVYADSSSDRDVAAGGSITGALKRGD